MRRSLCYSSVTAQSSIDNKVQKIRGLIQTDIDREKIRGLNLASNIFPKKERGNASVASGALK